MCMTVSSRPGVWPRVARQRGMPARERQPSGAPPAVNTALMLDFVLLFLLAYRLSWATGLYWSLSPEDVRIKRHTARAYYAGLVLSVMALLAAAAHLVMRDLLLMRPEISTGFTPLAAALLAAAAVIAIRYGRFREGPMEDRPRAG